MLLGQKITERVAKMRNLPIGIDQRSACRHPDWTGPDDLAIKITELREITNWEKPIYVKVGATRPYYDTALAVKSGADVVVQIRGDARANAFNFQQPPNPLLIREIADGSGNARDQQQKPPAAIKRRQNSEADQCRLHTHLSAGVDGSDQKAIRPRR